VPPPCHDPLSHAIFPFHPATDDNDENNFDTHHPYSISDNLTSDQPGSDEAVVTQESSASSPPLTKKSSRQTKLPI